jgi:hypothetical protein
MQLRADAIEARKQYGNGKITVEQLYAAFDAYIAGIAAHCKATGKRTPKLSRSYLIRAL